MATSGDRELAIDSRACGSSRDTELPQLQRVPLHHAFCEHPGSKKGPGLAPDPF